MMGSSSEQDFGKFLEEMKGMRAEMRGMFKELNVKLKNIDDKFSGIYNELRDEIDEIKEDVDNSKADIENIKKQTDGIEKSIEFQSGKVEDMEKQQKEKINRLEEQIKTLTDNIKMVEKQERKYNLIFHGIEEEKNERLYEKMRIFFEEKMGIAPEKVSQIHFSNGHRLSSRNVGPKPVIMRFSCFEDRELVISNAYKLAGSGKSILTDLPVKMKEERSRLAKCAYEIRKNEKLKTRIRDLGLDMVLVVRRDGNDKWVKRKV